MSRAFSETLCTYQRSWKSTDYDKNDYKTKGKITQDTIEEGKIA